MLVVAGGLEGYPEKIPKSMFCTSDKSWVDMCVADVVACVSMCLTSSNKPELISLCRGILPRMGLIYFM